MKTFLEKNEAVAKAFVSFLKVNDAFIPYMRATKNQTNKSTFSHFLRHMDKCMTKEVCFSRWRGFIFSSFVWGYDFDDKTPMYWARLNNEWCRILDKLIRMDFEIKGDVARAILQGEYKQR